MIRRNKCLQVAAPLLVIFIVIALNRCFLECSVHPLDLSVAPGRIDLGETMFDAMRPAEAIENIGEGAAVFFTVGELWIPLSVRMGGSATLR